MYNVIIAGGRDFDNYGLLSSCVKSCLLSVKLKNTRVVSGTARGADRLGERFAKHNNLDLRCFPANWDEYGKAAGYIRNKEMAKYADCLIAFWDGKSKGTKHMIDLAKEEGLDVYIFNYMGIGGKA